jgi:hypothetical protein
VTGEPPGSVTVMRWVFSGTPRADNASP